VSWSQATTGDYQNTLMNQDLLNLRVDEIKWELPDVATFYLVNTGGKKVHYKAGQFITLVFNHHGEEVRRSYSLSSSPYEDRLAITVKRISNGEISRFLLTKVKVGDIIIAVKPAGVFTLRDEDIEAEKDMVFFAAGSGITPVFSQLKYLLNQPGKSKAHLIYSSLDKQSIIFNNELNALAHKFPHRLNITYLLSSDANRLNNLIVERLVNNQIVFSRDKAEFYLCGPFVYMRMIRLTLSYMGIEAQQIHKEWFWMIFIHPTIVVRNYTGLQ
jgi:ferredoxin-NADP reductase